MTVPGRRPQRIGQQIRHEISSLLVRGLKDPRIGFATITGVEVSPDLRQARVYVSIMGSAEQQQEGLRGFAAAAAYLRRQLAHRLRMRCVPELSFELDTSIAYGERIDALLEETHRTAKEEESEDSET